MKGYFSEYANQRAEVLHNALDCCRPFLEHAGIAPRIVVIPKHIQVLLLRWYHIVGVVIVIWVSTVQEVRRVVERQGQRGAD